MVQVSTSTSLLLAALLTLTSARGSQKHAISASHGGLHRTPTTTSPKYTLKLARSNPLAALPNAKEKRQTCSGTCSDCFGSGYTLCPSSSITCYLPGDSIYGLDSCDSSSSSTGSDPAYPTTTGSAGSADVCSGVAATCVSCFGAGYLDCGNGVDCYNPADPRYDTCPDGITSSPGSDDDDDTTTTTSSCEALHGPGNIPCAPDGCYNPGDGEVCCADGYYCDEGETCSSEVGQCCSEGSSASGCSGTGSGISSNNALSSLTSLSSITTASSTRAGGGLTSTPTTNSNVGTTISGQSSGAAGGAAVGWNTDGMMMVKVVGVVVLGFGGILIGL